MNERPNIDEIKAQLANAIVRLIDEKGIAAGQDLVLTETEIIRLRSLKLDGFSIDTLIDTLNSLSQRVSVSVAPATGKSSGDPRPIWEKIAEISASIPLEEWDELPADLAANHDHYLYGAQKRP